MACLVPNEVRLNHFKQQSRWTLHYNAALLFDPLLYLYDMLLFISRTDLVLQDLVICMVSSRVQDQESEQRKPVQCCTRPVCYVLLPPQRKRSPHSRKMVSANLSSLLVEMKNQIIENLDYPDALSLKRTNNHFKTIVDVSPPSDFFRFKHQRREQQDILELLRRWHMIQVGHEPCYICKNFLSPDPDTFGRRNRQRGILFDKPKSSSEGRS